jgi:hypothetical protein
MQWNAHSTQPIVHWERQVKKASVHVVGRAADTASQYTAPGMVPL